MNILIKYNKCIYCNSKKLIKIKKQNHFKNFYVRAIISDLKLKNKDVKKIKVFKCSNCKLVQNNPWFSEEIARKIYSNIYGQHNRGWTNLLDFLKNGNTPDHGKLFDILNKSIKIKSYAEFNSPFMGMMINFFSKEYKNSRYFYKNLLKYIIIYLSSRQVAGKSKRLQKLSFEKSKTFFNSLYKLKNKNLIKKRIKKYLFTDNSSLCWGQNDNYKSVNSRSFATEMFDLKILDLDKKEGNKIKIDLFGIFHTLDHTYNPNKILKYALKVSKYVVVYCHVNESLSKQHLFSVTKEFLHYLNKQNIYTLDLTNMIDKKYKSPELYFLCSKKKIYI